MWDDEYEYHRTTCGGKVLVDVAVLAMAILIAVLTIAAGIQ